MHKLVIVTSHYINGIWKHGKNRGIKSPIEALCGHNQLFIQLDKGIVTLVKIVVGNNKDGNNRTNDEKWTTTIKTYTYPAPTS